MFEKIKRQNIKKYFLGIGLLVFLPIFLFQSRFLSFLIPIPFVYGFFRYGRKMFFLITAVSLIMSSLFESSLLPLIFFMIMILTSYIFSEIAARKRHVTVLLLKSVSILFLCYVGLGMILSKGHLYQNLHSTISAELKSLPQLLEQNSASLKEIWKTPPAQLENWKTKTSQLAKNADSLTAQFLQEKLLGYIISGILLILWFTILILKSLNIELTATNLRQWKAPDHLVWLFIVSAVFNEITVPLFTPVFKNIFILLTVIYFLQGLSIAAFFFNQKKYSTTRRNILYAFLIIVPLFTTVIGFFDLWINFRKHILKGEKESALNH